MNTANRKTIFFSLKTICPVHIGCDEVYEPTSFVVDENKKQLISFAPADFLDLLDDEALHKFSAICQKGTPQSLIEIYRFMNNHQELIEGDGIEVSEAFIGHFQDTLRLNGDKDIVQNLNRYQIKRTSFNPHDDIPYIPGSSIKGSIRTAVLNYRNKGKKSPSYGGRNASADLEKNLVGGSFDTDPFRLIKVSDFIPVGEVKRRIVYGVNRKKKPSKFEAKGPEQIFEVVAPGAVFLGSITILAVPPGATIRQSVSAEEIMNALKLFYGGEKAREERELSAVSIPVSPLSADKAQFPMRLGFHSGAECVTVEGHRKIKIMKGRGGGAETKDHATTFWLAADSKKAANQKLCPFGWVTLRELSAAEAQSEQEKLRCQRQEQARVEQQILLRQEKEAQARQERLLAQRREEERQAAEAAAWEAELEAAKERWQSMSDEERDLALINEDEFARQQAPDVDILQQIWPKIKTAESVHQKALAAAFRDLWQRQGNWNVKKSKKKQLKKVQLVKKILAEN